MSSTEFLHAGSGQPGYYRFPTIHDDVVVFVSEDDLWQVPAAGGPARRVTAGQGRARFPRISPDGKWLAFSGTEEGPMEVFVMPAGGGRPRRLTFQGSMALVCGWDPQGHILYASPANQHTMRFTAVYRVHPEGGQPEQLPIGPALTVSYGASGGLVLGRYGMVGREPAYWKRYRGGTAGDLWIDVKGKGIFNRLIELPGNLTHPLWLGERIYFTSDHEGIGNLYSTTPEGADLTRHTSHEDYYVRHPSTDGRRIVYHAGADLFLFDPASGSGTKIDVDYSSPRTGRNRKYVGAAKYLDEYSPHPQGYLLATVIRGKSYHMGLFEGPAIQHGESDGVRYREVQWLQPREKEAATPEAPSATTPSQTASASTASAPTTPDPTTPDQVSLAMVSDADGEERIEIHEGAPEATVRRLSKLDLGWIQRLVAAPKGRRLAVTNHRSELWLVDVDGEEATKVDASDRFLIRHVSWSADGRWLAYAFTQSIHVTVIKLYNVETKEQAVATPPAIVDTAPIFDPEGKYLYFLSNRELNPVYDTVHFDLGFPRAFKPYLITLRKDVPNPFLPQPTPDGGGDSDAASQKAKADSSDKAAGDADGDSAAGAPSDDKPVERVDIDLEGIQERMVAFPLEEARYTQLEAIPGKLLYATVPIEGAAGRNIFGAGAPPAKATLSAFDFKTMSSDVLVSGITTFEVAADSKTLIYRAGNKLRSITAGEKADEKSAQEGPGRKSGWIDLSRIKISLVPPAEWRQMFREAWRMQRDNFWNAEMSDVDWLAVYRRYEPLLDRIATRGEFSDLMWEMQGELGTSHAYEIGGDYPASPQYHQGFLGADISYDSRTSAWRIDRIASGAAWSDEAGSPLSKPGVNVHAGDRVLALNGAAVGADRSPHELLVNQAGSEVALTVADGDGENPRTVVVKTVGSEFPIRYRDWVETNRRRVHEATKGRVGYIHVPNMGADGYAEFHRSFLPEVDREGLIVDVRFNGGGHVSPLLLEKLARRRMAYVTSRWFGVEPWPDDAPPEPMVALTNEQAGSDGDIFSHSFKLMKLGPLVGKRTWGGVIGIYPRQFLVDRTITTQPEFSFWFEDVGWAVENYGTDPDIEVEITPQDYGAGRDPQLDRAIEEVEKILASHTPKKPSLADRPSRKLPRLEG